MFLQCFCKQYSMRKHESSPIHIPIKRRKDTPSFEKEMEKLTIRGARAQKGKTSFEKNGKAHRLLSKGTRRGIELRFRPHEPSKEKKLQQKDQNEVNQKKSLTFSSPGTCLHKSSHQFHSEAHTGDSSLDFLVFFITKG